MVFTREDGDFHGRTVSFMGYVPLIINPINTLLVSFLVSGHPPSLHPPPGTSLPGAVDFSGHAKTCESRLSPKVRRNRKRGVL